jgi:hypothetical protein
MWGQHVTIRQKNLVLAEVVDKPSDRILVLRIARVVLAGAVRCSWERTGVNVLGSRGEAGDAAGDVAVIQTLRRLRQVGEGDEPAITLAEGVPAPVTDHGAAQYLGVGDDRIGAEQT